MTIKMFDDKFSTPTGRVKPTDLNDTNSFLLQQAASGQAELAFKTLQSNNIFENGGSLATDEYVDADGTNDTVNVGSTTAGFTTNHYEQGPALGSDVVTNGAASFSSGGNQTDEFGVRFTTNKKVLLKSCTKQSGGTPATRAVLMDDAGSVIQVATFSGDIATFSPGVVLEDATTYRLEYGKAGSSYTLYNGSPLSYPYASTNLDIIAYSVNGGSTGTGSYWNVKSITTAEFSGFLLESSIVHDVNLLEINSLTKAFCLYTKSIIPTNTSISYDISDGVNTINLPVNEITNKTEVIPIGLLNTTSNITLTTKLVSANSTITPETYGFAIKRID